MTSAELFSLIVLQLSTDFRITHRKVISFLVLVLGLAFGEGSDLDQLVFVGMVGIIDPPREGVREAVEILLSAGINLKMVTGDSEHTAVAIGGEINLQNLAINWGSFDGGAHLDP